MTQDLSFFVKQVLEAPVQLAFLLDSVQFQTHMGDMVSSDPPAQVRGELQVEKIQGSLLVTGSMTGIFSVPCSRCLEPATVVVEEPVRFVLLPAPVYSGKEIELVQDDLDTIYYEGERVDLEPHLWDQIILSIPPQPLCVESCPGIPVPGPRLPDADSACETGFSVLKTLSLKQPEGFFPARK